VTLSPATSRTVGGDLDYVEYTADVSVTQTTESAATVLVTGNAVVFDGATIVNIIFYSLGCKTPAVLGDQLVVNLWQDGADIGRIAQVQTAAVAATGAPVYGIRRMTPSAGSHTYSMRGWISAAGTATVQAGAGGAGVSLPGFIRITRAG
jgi:hypothetical protein